MPEPAQRFSALLAEVEAQLVAARDHEDAMAAAMGESADWPSGSARGWVAGAMRDAAQARRTLELRLADGNEIAARAAEGMHA